MKGEMILNCECLPKRKKMFLQSLDLHTNILVMCEERPFKKIQCYLSSLIYLKNSHNKTSVRIN